MDLRPVQEANGTEGTGRGERRGNFEPGKGKYRAGKIDEGGGEGKKGERERDRGKSNRVRLISR